MRLRELLTELNRPSNIHDAESILRDAGYRRYGNDSAFGRVFGRPDDDYVVKIFEDTSYLRFLDLVLKRPNRHFPIVKGKPTKISGPLWAVRLEKLEPVNGSNIELRWRADEYLANFINLAQAEQELYHGSTKGGGAGLPHYGDAWRSPDDQRLNYEPITRLRQDAMPLEQHYPDLAEALRIIATNLLIPNHIGSDLHEENCMQRGATIVITDPISKQIPAPEKITRTPNPQLQLPMNDPYDRLQHKTSDVWGDQRELSNRLPISRSHEPDPNIEPAIPGTDKPYGEQERLIRQRRLQR